MDEQALELWLYIACWEWPNLVGLTWEDLSMTPYIHFVGHFPSAEAARAHAEAQTAAGLYLVQTRDGRRVEAVEILEPSTVP